MHEGTVANIREDGSYPVKAENGRIVMVKECPLWFTKGDKVTYKVTEVLKDKKFDIGEYVSSTRYGLVLDTFRRGCIVKPPRGGKYVKVARVKPWIKKEDKIPYELTLERPKANTDLGIFADKSIGGSMVVITFFLSDKKMIIDHPEGAYFCVMGLGGDLFKRVSSEIWNKHFLTVGDEYMSSQDEVSDRGFLYRVAGHQDTEFLLRTIIKDLYDYNINTGNKKTKNRFIHLEEVVLTDEETDYINGLGIISFHGIVDILRDYSEEILRENLFS